MRNHLFSKVSLFLGILLFTATSAFANKLDIGVGLGLGRLGTITDDAPSNDLDGYAHGIRHIILSIQAIGHFNDNMALRFGIESDTKTLSGNGDEIPGFKKRVGYTFPAVELPVLFRYYPIPRFYAEAGLQAEFYGGPQPYARYDSVHEDPVDDKDIELNHIKGSVLVGELGVGTRFDNGIELSLTSTIGLTPSAEARTFRSFYTDAPVRFYTINFTFAFYFLKY